MAVLRRVHEHVVELLVAFRLIAVSQLLALNAVRGPRHCGQALRRNLFFTMHARTERSIVQTAQGATHIAEQVRFAVQIADGELALRSVLNFVECIGALLDGDALAMLTK